MNDDFQFCFDMANAFYDVGKLSNEYDREKSNSSILFKGEAYYAFPAIVNLAFACELYLKALLCKKGYKAGFHTHELDQLFCMLPIAVQNHLSTDFSAKCSYSVPLFQTLKTHSKAFEKWRYAYEGDKRNVEAYPDNLQLAAEVMKDYFSTSN
jgi:CRISPR/Cas system-associated endonuclease Cas3-HD